MTKKVLVVATSDIHLQVFHLPYFEMLKGMGCTIDIAVEIRGNGIVPFTDKLYNLPFKRTLFSAKLLSAYRGLQTVIDRGNYDLIHCHTPIPAAITRLAARRARKKGTKVMYTAHGFHFYKGGPLLSWLTFYPAEKLFSKLTDVLITINKEDYEIARNRFYATETYYMKGIGVSTKFKPENRALKEQCKVSMGYAADNFILFYAANFIKRKNHIFILNALVRLKDVIPNVKVLFAGQGILLSEMKDFVKNNKLEAFVDFLGFRNDVDKLLELTDISISASKHEGLGLALAEAMFSGVPVVASVDRGHKEMIDSGINGFLFEQGSQQEFVDCIVKIYHDKSLAQQFIDRSKDKVQQFSIKNSLEFMKKIYHDKLDLYKQA